MFGRKFDGGEIVATARGDVIPPNVAAGLHRNIGAQATGDHDVAQGRDVLAGLVEQTLHLDRLAAA